jgi:hypothetical protein
MNAVECHGYVGACRQLIPVLGSCLVWRVRISSFGSGSNKHRTGIASDFWKQFQNQMQILYFEESNSQFHYVWNWNQIFSSSGDLDLELGLIFRSGNRTETRIKGGQGRVQEPHLEPNFWFHLHMWNPNWNWNCPRFFFITGTSGSS